MQKYKLALGHKSNEYVKFQRRNNHSKFCACTMYMILFECMLCRSRGSGMSALLTDIDR